MGLAGLSVITFAALVALLLVYAMPALQQFGLSFFTTTTWDPVFLSFGAAHFIFGTIVTSFIALLIATPIAVGAALFVAEYAPEWLREPVSFVTELLAVIPASFTASGASSSWRHSCGPLLSPRCRILWVRFR